ncbi:MAG: permease, partial [Chloroflexi bacterium]|nr:permease [Chloroflexota bacterium]
MDPQISIASSPHLRSDVRTYVAVGLMACIWLLAYTIIQPLADWLAYGALGLPHGSRPGEAVAFFL